MAEKGKHSAEKRLRELFGRFVRSRSAYQRPLLWFFEVFREAQLPAVVFGGTLRDLAIKGSSEQPRDVDVVVDTSTLEAVESLFGAYVRKRTRFGGLHLNIGLWPIDIWPLAGTWALRQRAPAEITFADLPTTTFLDVEAVAAEIWPERGQARRLFGNRFFAALEERTVGINHQENPFPELCVVRALLTAARLDFGLAPGLVKYVIEAGAEMAPHHLEMVQIDHYGKVRCDGRIMKSWIDFLRVEAKGGNVAERLPVDKPLQLAFWQDWTPSC